MKKKTKKKAAKVANPAKLTLKLIATLMNSKKKVYGACVYFQKGDKLSCGEILASSEADAKRVAKAIAKRQYGITL